MLQIGMEYSRWGIVRETIRILVITFRFHKAFQSPLWSSPFPEGPLLGRWVLGVEAGDSHFQARAQWPSPLIKLAATPNI